MSAILGIDEINRCGTALHVEAKENMHVDQLRAFDRVVREGGFGRAALALGIGQPAVSARIQALEEVVGGALFVRGRRIALTPLGESFLPYARRALEVLGEGLDAARLAERGHRGRVRMGVLGSLAGGLVGPALTRFARRHPEVEVVVRSGAHELVLELLLDGLVDVALVVWPAEHADLAPLRLFREPVLLVTHESHPLAEKRTVEEAELVARARPFLALRWWRTHHPELSRLASLCGPTFEVPMETARELVLKNAAVGFFPKVYVAAELASGPLREVGVARLPRIVRDSALVRRKRALPLSPPLVTLVEAIGAEADRLGILRRGAPHAAVEAATRPRRLTRKRAPRR
jgi:DNA-binding transcriptional LysR family regulator